MIFILTAFLWPKVGIASAAGLVKRARSPEPEREMMDEEERWTSTKLKTNKKTLADGMDEVVQLVAVSHVIRIINEPNEGAVGFFVNRCCGW